MVFQTVENDSLETTVSIDIMKRSYTANASMSIFMTNYDEFYGEVVKVYRCSEVMDEDTVMHVLNEIHKEFGTSTSEIYHVSDTDGDLTNTGIWEIQVVKVEEHTSSRKGLPAITPDHPTYIVYKRHNPDPYFGAVFDVIRRENGLCPQKT